MLEGIDTVPWLNLHHALGPADDVPDLLRGLVSSDGEQRWEALYRLMETIWHQGTVYEATSRVVPFLVKMLQDDRTPDCGIVAFLLASIADGRSSLEGYVEAGSGMEETWREVLADQGKDFEVELKRELAWVEAVRAEVGPGIPLLYPFLDHGDPEVRRVITLALASYPQHAASSTDQLMIALQSEPDPDVRQAMEDALTLLSQSD